MAGKTGATAGKANGVAFGTKETGERYSGEYDAA